MRVNYMSSYYFIQYSIGNVHLYLENKDFDFVKGRLGYTDTTDPRYKLLELNNQFIDRSLVILYPPELNKQSPDNISNAVILTFVTKYGHELTHFYVVRDTLEEVKKFSVLSPHQVCLVMKQLVY